MHGKGYFLSSLHIPFSNNIQNMLFKITCWPIVRSESYTKRPLRRYTVSHGKRHILKTRHLSCYNICVIVFVTRIFKLRIIHHCVKNNTPQVGLELKSTSTGVPTPYLLHQLRYKCWFFLCKFLLSVLDRKLQSMFRKIVHVKINKIVLSLEHQADQ